MIGKHVQFSTVRLLSFALLALALLGGLLLVGAEASAKVLGPNASAPTSKTQGDSKSPGMAPLLTDTPTATPTCGLAAWATQASYPVAVRFNAVVALGGLAYSFGGDSGAGAIANAYVYNPANNTWTAIASLPAARYGASAVTDGISIYIVNGLDISGSRSSTLYRYDPAANSYTTMAAAPIVTGHQAAAYLSGKIYRVGGIGAGGAGVNSVDVYNIAGNTWSPVGTIANYPTTISEEALVSNGAYLYAAGGLWGGVPSAQTFRYDPVSNTWNDAAITNLPQFRMAAAFGVLNGRFVLAGGDNGSYTDSVVSLDLSAPTGAWASLPNLPAVRWRMGGASVGVAFFTVGGNDGSSIATSSVHRYYDFPCTITNTPTSTNTATRTFTPTNTPTRTNTATGANTPTNTITPTNTPASIPCGNVWTTQTPYPTTVSSLATTALNGLLYSFGGITNTDTSAAYRYDPTTNTWTALASLPAARSGASAVTDGTYIYILGGSIGGNHTNTVYRYDPVANSYTTMAAMPLITTRQSVAYLSGKIYRIGGCNPGNCSFGTAQVDVYTIATNTWASGPAYPIGVSYASAVVRGGFIYVAGGMDGNGVETSKTYRLDPTTNLWDDAAIADLPEAPKESAGDLLNGRWILAGGRNGLGQLLGAVAWDPVGNTWSTVSGMPTPAFAPGAATVGGALYVVGGDAFGRTNLLRRYTEGPACTATPTNTPSPTNTRTNTPTQTFTLTTTPTITSTPTRTVTQTNTQTITPTATRTNTPTITNTLTPTPVGYIRVDSGGPGGIDSQGNLWSADYGFTGGSPFTTTSPISNTNDPWIYQNERFSMSNYTFNLPNGYYNVRLHLAEIWPGITGPGQRVFSVNMNGTVLSNIDKYAESGGLYIAMVRSAIVQVTNGQLVIAFTAQIQNPAVNGIEIVPSAPPTATVTNTPTATSTPTNTPTITNTSTLTPTRTPTDTPTPTPVAPTNTPIPAGVIVGHVTWQGIPQPDVRNAGVTATLSLCVGGVPTNYSAATDASGYFTVTTGLPDGTYNWWVKGQRNLANSGSLSMTGSTANQEMGMMRAGDCNNDNAVSVADFNILKNTFGKTMGDADYDNRADFNRDNTISVTDFNNQKGNFGQSGTSLSCP